MHPSEIIQGLVHLLVKIRGELDDGALSGEGHLLCLPPDSQHIDKLLHICTSRLEVEDKVDEGVHLPAQPAAALFVPVDGLGIIHEVVDKLLRVFRPK